MDGKKPLDCFGTDEAESYIGKECYFSDDLFPFADMSDRTNRDLIYKGILLKVSADGSDPYETDSQRFYTYCLPCDWVAESEEKKLRPYTLMEFTNKFTVGCPIKFRIKGKVGCEQYMILTGYVHEQRNGQTFTYIYIGPSGYTLQELFEEYEWQKHYTEDFKPFGVEDTE
jgi:hypothetical protein